MFGYLANSFHPPNSHREKVVNMSKRAMAFVAGVVLAGSLGLSTAASAAPLQGDGSGVVLGTGVAVASLVEPNPQPGPSPYPPGSPIKQKCIKVGGRTACIAAVPGASI